MSFRSEETRLRSATERDDGQMPPAADELPFKLEGPCSARHDLRPDAALPAARQGNLVVHWASENFL